MNIIHRGHSLTQRQLDAIVPVLNDYMHSEISLANLETEVDKALEAAGCPVLDEAFGRQAEGES